MSRPDLSGTVVGDHFALKSRLGSGHFGDVYLCENAILAREAALKVVKIDPNNANTAVLEAQLLSLSQHSHIVKVLSAAGWTNQSGELHLIIEMEYVPGGSLEDAIKKEISIGDTVKIIKNVLFALDHAHPDIIHRDVKPANILLGGGGKLSDFGIALLTTTGVSVSELQYVLNKAPECFGPSNTFSVATDIYAAGLTLLRTLNLVTDWKGTLLSTFGSASDVTARMRAGTLVAGLGFHPRVPSALTKIIKRACATNPTKRYVTASAFRDALEALKIARDWRRTTPEKWECEFQGKVEQLIVAKKTLAFEVTYTRNGRRKTEFTRSFADEDGATKYVYEIIAANTLAPT